MKTQPLYALRKGEVFAALETCPEGLTEEQAAARRALYGWNILAEPPAAPAWRTLWRSAAHSTGALRGPMALLLWAAGLAAGLSGRLGLGLVIWGVVLVNAGFSFWRERRAGQAVAALGRLLPVYARVVRAGRELRLPASQLVPGDVLVLAEGDSIPADARLVEAYGLRTNNSTLTGESLPALKNAEASIPTGLSEIERPNLVFAGTSVMAGTGRAVVAATGMSTQFGRIAHLTQALAERPSLLQAQMARISRVVSQVALGLAVFVFIVGISEVGIPPQEAFILAVGILVAAIPEGLAPTVTLTLAAAVQRLARQGILVKKLSAVETLGAVSVICTDKSGTLTQNQMTVRKLWLGGARVNVSGVGYEPKGRFNSASFHPADLEALSTAALLCNNARLVSPAGGERRWSALGDQTEAALKVLAGKAGLDEPALARRLPRLHELPFDAHRKRMSTLHRSGEGALAFVKGAPGEVLQLCTAYQRNGQVLPLDEATRAEILQCNDDFASQALRVLALARRELPPAARSGGYTPQGVESSLTFLGLAGMMDPPRPEIARAVQAFQAAGIRLVMLTGDYGLTAESVARRVGMLRTAAPRILTGADLDALDDSALAALLGEEIIYARMAPEHKLRLVGAFQAAGEVVAVVGDGVNDVPALRKADAGIAMGDTATDVARQAADTVVVGDDFSLIVRAVEEGRAVYDNLRKFITYIFASNVPEILPFILAALFNIPLALTVTQILAIDLGTDLLPALALGMERPEPDVMLRPPRRRAQPVVDRALLVRSLAWLGGIETALCYAAFFLTLTALGSPILNAKQPGHIYLLATTVFHAGVVMAQAGNAFACRTEQGHVRRLGWLSNPTLLLGIGVELALIIATIYLAPLARLFDHAPLPPALWLVLGLFGPLVYGLEWVRKYLVRRRKI